uniref:WWE domain-containing protein n=1 Tax=Angiostrongylus cantonensis TaxID=6313 RepID=A0A0K0DQF2_ANGCA
MSSPFEDVPSMPIVPDSPSEPKTVWFNLEEEGWVTFYLPTKDIDELFRLLKKRASELSFGPKAKYSAWHGGIQVDLSDADLLAEVLRIQPAVHVKDFYVAIMVKQICSKHPILTKDTRKKESRGRTEDKERLPYIYLHLGTTTVLASCSAVYQPPEQMSRGLATEQSGITQMGHLYRENMQRFIIDYKVKGDLYRRISSIQKKIDELSIPPLVYFIDNNGESFVCNVRFVDP